MDIFEECSKINDFLASNDQLEARNNLIKLLDAHEKEDIPYSELVNHLIRETGLFPYLEPETATWQDRFALESFKVDVGIDEPITLHS